MNYKFLQDKITGKWVVVAPRRQSKQDISHEASPFCPFCPGSKEEESDLFRINGRDNDEDWEVRVVPNKYPFAPIHELIIHSPDHHKNFDELPVDHIMKIIKTYKKRYSVHKEKGKVILFHNRGEVAGESIPHPHTQLVVVPREVNLEIPRFCPEPGETKDREWAGEFNYNSLIISVLMTSQWPDEVWVSSKSERYSFDDMPGDEVEDLAFVLRRIIRILNLRHKEEFPFNFYIDTDEWYLRIIPRVKTLGGFELGTGVYVNTMDPKDTLSFIKEHFDTFDEEKIKRVQEAEYKKSA